MLSSEEYPESVCRAVGSNMYACLTETALRGILRIDWPSCACMLAKWMPNDSCVGTRIKHILIKALVGETKKVLYQISTTHWWVAGIQRWLTAGWRIGKCLCDLRIRNIPIQCYRRDIDIQIIDAIWIIKDILWYHYQPQVRMIKRLVLHLH